MKVNITQFTAFIITSWFTISSVRADTVECPARTIEKLMVQGDRDDNHPFANKLVILLNEPCNGMNYTYIENTHNAYDGMLSASLTAHATNSPVDVYVNSSKTSGPANQLSFLVLRK